MATAESVKAKLQGLIDKADNVMGGKRNNLTTAVNSLINGYGNEPIPYEDAEDGDVLYKTYFATENFTPIDDVSQAINNNGTIYDGYGFYEPSGWKGEHRKNLATFPIVGESTALKVDGVDTTGVTDHRYVGRFPMYDLENKTYTYTVEYFRNFDYRHKFYFACGTFIDKKTGGTITGDWCDTYMPCLAFQIQRTDSGKVMYNLVRQSSIIWNNKTNIHHDKKLDFVRTDGEEFTANFKVVLKGGAKQYVTLYKGHGGLNMPEAGGTHWVGYIIPIDFEIYHSINGEDILVAEGCVYQPADVPLVCGVGNWDVLPEGQYYGIRNLIIYKGDRTVALPTSDIKAYHGTYSVTPTLNEQTLATANKYLSRDIIVQSIPVAEVSNSAGGTTITIG